MDGGFEDGRERARRTRHDALYGVLAECDTDYDSDDGNGCRRRRKRRRDASAEPDLSRPVRFVSSGSVLASRDPGPGGGVNATAKEDDEAKAAAEEEEVGIPTMFGKIRQGARARREKKERERAAASRASRTQASSVKPPPPAAPGSVRSNAKVIGMMRSMRYVDGMGLGKDGQGITEPVAVTERHKNAGLGYGGEEPVMMTQSSAKENLAPPPPPPMSSISTKEHPPRWSKKARARKKNALPAMRAEQALEEADEGHGHPAVVQMMVIDRRGRQERVLTDLRGLNDDEQCQGQETQADDDGAPVPELRHNVRLLVDVTGATVASLDSQLRREHEKAASLALEELRLSKQEAAQRRRLQATETIAAALEQVRADDAAGALTLDGLLLTFGDLKARFAAEFEACGVAWVACTFARPLLLRLFHGWQPLADPSLGLELMSSWKGLVEGDGDQPYALLVCEVVVPRVRMAGTNSWEARVPEPKLDFLTTWRQVLPRVALQLILEHVVMPKLSAAVDSWDPRWENVPIHVWVHPWLPMLEQSSVEALCHAVRCKLSSVLGAWRAHDTSAHALLSPWKNVFDSAVWEDLVARYVVPKLKMAMQEFQINPADQKKLDRFRSVMIWAPTIPVRCMVRLLEADFFSKWHQVLYHWLCSPNPDFDEIVGWYKCWKDSFPPELLADARIRMLFALGLDMMDRAAEGLEVVQPGTGENMAFLGGSGTETLQVDAAEKASQFPSCHGATEPDLSFKECIQAYAVEKGLLFMPRVGRFYNGMPVYEFGSVNICIDSVKRVVYAQLGEEIELRWSAVSLRQLVEMNWVGRTC